MHDRFVVTSRTLYVRTAPSTVSEIIGILRQGDTVVAVVSGKYWVMVRNGYTSGYVSTDYLKKIEYPSTPKFLKLVERSANWQNWQFWVIAIALLLVWVIAEELIIRAKHFLKKRYDFNIKEVIVSYVTFFVVGLLSGIIYLYWKDYFIESFTKGLSANSLGTNIVTISIWIQLSLLAISIFYDYLGSIFKTGLRFGTLLSFMDFLFVFFILSTTFFLVIALNYYAIVFLIVFFTSRYIHVVYQNGIKHIIRK